MLVVVGLSFVFFLFAILVCAFILCADTLGSLGNFILEKRLLSPCPSWLKLGEGFWALD